MARLRLFLAALWWGSMTAVGFWVVPLLFVHLESPAQAGQMAGKLFTAQTWVSVGCGVSWLLSERRRVYVDATDTPSRWVIAGLLLAMALEVGVKPHILARENMALWHNLGSALFLLQWACATQVLWQQGHRPAQAQPEPDTPD